MLIFKVVFWLYAFGVLVGLIISCKDHPRQPQAVNIGTDIVFLIVKVGITVFLYLGIWG